MTTNKPDYPVVIVGAGMVGAALACALHDVGIPCLVIEANSLSSQDSWAEDDVDPRVSALNVASQNVLQQLGAWPKIQTMQRLQAYERMYVWDAMGTAHIEFTAAEQHQSSLGHILENRTITAALHACLLERGIEVIEHAQLHDMSTQASAPRTIFLANDRVITANLVVGADGAMSKVRALAGLATREWDYPHHALVTRVALSKHHQGTAWQRFTENGVLAMLPLRSPAQTQTQATSHCSIVWSQPQAAASDCMNMPTSDFCNALERAFEGRLGTVLDSDARHVFPLRQRHAKQYVQRGLALVGDAAHTIHPLAGQGVNLGFMDVAALTQVLAEASQGHQDIADVSVLQRYQRLRRGDNMRMAATMEIFARLFGNQHPTASLVRNYGLGMAQQLPALKKHLAQQALGLGAKMPPLARDIRHHGIS